MSARLGALPEQNNPEFLTLLSRPSLSLSKRRKMAVAAASTGTAGAAAKGRIETEAILVFLRRGGLLRLGIGRSRESESAKRAREQDWGLPLALVGEGPREGFEKKRGAKRIVLSEGFFLSLSLFFAFFASSLSLLSTKRDSKKHEGPPRAAPVPLRPLLQGTTGI